MKKAIVTGSEGFIGKALCRRLEKYGVEVVRVDRRDPVCPMEAEEIYRYTERGDIDCVFHLAAQTSVFNEDLRQICNDNITTFVGVVDSCRRDNVPLVYASSSTANPCNTTSLYGISKRFDEEFAMCYYGKAIGVRLHNVYGPEPRKGTLLWHMQNDDVINLYNKGENRRHFTYIDDIIDGLITAPALIGEYPIINVANPEEVSVLEFWLEFCEARKAATGIVPTGQMRWPKSVRKFDKEEQRIDESIFTLPLHYTSVSDGLRKVAEHPSTLKALNSRALDAPLE